MSEAAGGIGRSLPTKKKKDKKKKEVKIASTNQTPAPTERSVSPYAKKSREDIDRLINEAERKFSTQTTLWKKMMKTCGSRPSGAVKTEMMDLKKELKTLEEKLELYRRVKEEKIPYWEKLKDHCSATPFYKYTIAKMMRGGVQAASQNSTEKLVMEVMKQR